MHPNILRITFGKPPTTTGKGWSLPSSRHGLARRTTGLCQILERARGPTTQYDRYNSHSEYPVLPQNTPLSFKCAACTQYVMQAKLFLDSTNGKVVKILRKTEGGKTCCCSCWRAISARRTVGCSQRMNQTAIYFVLCIERPKSQAADKIPSHPLNRENM